MAPRRVNRLTPLDVRNATTVGLYADGGGLYLQVARNGSRSWILRFRFGPGKRHDLGLGPLHEVSLAQAREAAAAAHTLIREGIDPLAERRQRGAAARVAASKAVTFDQCAGTYIADHEGDWSKSNASQWRSRIAEPLNNRSNKSP